MKRNETLEEMFLRRVGYRMNAQNPRSFNEKIQWRKLFDHNETYPALVDKAESKKIARERCSGIRVFDTLWVGGDVGKIPFIVPSIIKNTSNSGSSWRILRELPEPDKANIRSQIMLSLSRRYGDNKKEWAYSQVPARAIVEHFEARPFIDVKFWVFDGSAKAIAIMEYEGGKIKSWTMFDERFKNLKVQSVPYMSLGIDFPIEKEHAEAGKRLAEDLSANMDFVRVDLYYVPKDNEWYFGEFTLYPTSGMARYSPVEFDHYLGSCWRIR